MLITESQYSDNSVMTDKKNSAMTDRNDSETADFENFSLSFISIDFYDICCSNVSVSVLLDSCSSFLNHSSYIIVVRGFFENTSVVVVMKKLEYLNNLIIQTEFHAVEHYINL